MSEQKALEVLLVEDDLDDQRLIYELLSSDCREKYSITVVSNLKETITALDIHSYEIVLTNLQLPDSSGLNTVEEIQKINPRIPVIVLRNSESEELSMQVVKMGAQDYLIKGQCDRDLMERAIRYAIERKRIERGLSFLAQYDSLTGLANRALFRERLNRAVVRAERNQTLVALMFIDLDRFKNVNDTLGHTIGDQLLVEVGERLKSCIRACDTVARLGGDEFTIILEDIKKADIA